MIADEVLDFRRATAEQANLDQGVYDNQNQDVNMAITGGIRYIIFECPTRLL